MVQITPRARRTLYLTSAALLAAFVGLVVAEHVLNPQLSPLTHQVSEYANARNSWVMTVAFAAWAGSLGLAARAPLGGAAGSRQGALLSMFLGLGGAGLVLAAVFHTQTVAGRLPAGTDLTVPGRLHDLGSGLATIALLAAAVTDAVARSAAGAVRRVTWLIVVLALTTDAILLAIGPSVGGLRERILIGLGCGWQLWWTLRQITAPPQSRSTGRGRAAQLP